MNKIFIVASWADIKTNNGFDRLSYVARTFSNNDFETTLVTSDYNHHGKKFHENINETLFDYKIKLIHELGYRGNISIKRILSHAIFARNIKKYLFQLKKEDYPNVIYVSMPFSTATLACKSFCKKNNIPLIVDVIDLWPEAFIGITSVPRILSQTMVLPWQLLSNKAYRCADAIVSHNYTYLNRALKETKENIPNEMVYLGSDLQFAEKCQEKYDDEIFKGEDEFWISYVGSLAENYDLDTIVLAVSKLKQKGINNIKILFLGTGPYENKLKGLAENLNVNYFITGYIEYAKLIAYLCKCDIAMNAIKNPVIIISYKTSDYFTAGLPIINSSKGELQNLIDKHKMGFYYKTGDVKMLAEKIETLYSDRNLLKQMKDNSKIFANQYLDKKKNYIKLVNLANNMLREKKI
ncbi:glycosyltransferase family 4 protein [Clostridium akagii]|uniref:glycosyltransferase family 4 protein n=1 Tax=Clostridium akagii TaxID=91623 RepID=UPI00047B8CEB|nr:glycosyltransferase family 4 protein [Clostridium akagii]